MMNNERTTENQGVTTDYTTFENSNLEALYKQMTEGSPEFEAVKAEMTKRGYSFQNKDALPASPIYERSEAYAALENHDLEAMYQQLTEGSPEFGAVMAEMTKRGYLFKTKYTRTESPSQGMENTNSKGSNAVWTVMYSILGLVFFILIVAGLTDLPGEVNATMVVAALVVGLATASFGQLVAGIRQLVNKIGHPGGYGSSGASYIVFGFFWALVTAAVIIAAIYTFVKFAGFSTEMAFKAAVVPLLIAFIPGAMAAAFFTLDREL